MRLPNISSAPLLRRDRDASVPAPALITDGLGAEVLSD
jgi:hypothetical protein